MTSQHPPFSKMRSNIHASLHTVNLLIPNRIFLTALNSCPVCRAQRENARKRNRHQQLEQAFMAITPEGVKQGSIFFPLAFLRLIIPFFHQLSEPRFQTQVPVAVERQSSSQQLSFHHSDTAISSAQ